MRANSDSVEDMQWPSSVLKAEVGAVTIGRNEASTLAVGLKALKRDLDYVIYVDSDSTDDSVNVARSKDVEVVCLDPKEAITVPKARNEGFRRLLELQASIRYVQFIDADCELQPGWLKVALEFMENHPEYAVISGMRRERHPDKSVFTMLAQMDWDTPTGDVQTCHGDHLMRVSAFQQIGGYNPEIVSQEEAEMCQRLLKRGWRLYCVDDPMSVHEMDITRFSQWWRRSVRTGFGYAELHYVYRRPEERKKLVRIVAWGFVVPILAVVSALFTSGLGLLLLALYPVQGYRIYRGNRAKGYDQRYAAVHAVACVIGYFPQFHGCLKLFRRGFGRFTAMNFQYKS